VHTVATVAYIAVEKAVRGAPSSFAWPTARRIAADAGDDPRARSGDLFDWAPSQAKGAEAPADPHRSHGIVKSIASSRRWSGSDAFSASDAPLAVTPERIFQGAIADARRHVGQLAMLRRLAGAKMKAENYSRAEIVVGRVGASDSAQPGVLNHVRIGRLPAPKP
jgi:hypothetical protein